MTQQPSISMNPVADRPITELRVGEKFVSSASMDKSNNEKAKYYEKLTSLFAETRQKIIEFN